MQKVILITGASSGLGKEIAKVFLNKGYLLILTGRNEKGLEEFKDHTNVKIIVGDLTDKNTRHKLVQLIKNSYNRLDILINNAGITFIQPFEENTEEQLDEIININLKAPILLTQNVIEILKNQQNGTIVFINSAAGKLGYPNHTMYSTTKFGLAGFAQSLRQEVKAHNIRVLTIHAGGINTQLYSKLATKPNIDSYMDPQKVAELVVYLSETEGLSPDEISISRLTK